MVRLLFRSLFDDRNYRSAMIMLYGYISKATTGKTDYISAVDVMNQYALLNDINNYLSLEHKDSNEHLKMYINMIDDMKGNK